VLSGAEVCNLFQRLENLNVADIKYYLLPTMVKGMYLRVKIYPSVTTCMCGNHVYEFRLL